MKKSKKVILCFSVLVIAIIGIFVFTEYKKDTGKAEVGEKLMNLEASDVYLIQTYGPYPDTGVYEITDKEVIERIVSSYNKIYMKNPQNIEQSFPGSIESVEVIICYENELERGTVSVTIPPEKEKWIKTDTECWDLISGDTEYSYIMKLRKNREKW